MKEKNSLDWQGYTVQNGSLYIEDLKASAIAQKCGTPLYVYSVRKLKQNMKEYTSAFTHSQFHTRVYYASKAFNTLAMLKLANALGLGADVVSAGELYTALQAGMDRQMILFHGNAKSEFELRMAFENGIGCIVCDNEHEAELIAQIASEYPSTTMDILLRINPGVEAHTHNYVVTAHVDSKFGILKDEMDRIVAIAKTIQAVPTLRFCGFHAHIGSQIFDKKAFEAEIETMGAFIFQFQQASGITVNTLDTGGGFAAYYTSEDRPIPVEEVCSTILQSVEHIQSTYGLSLENVWIEPGRSIVANAGCTLYSIDYVKQTPHKVYYFANGGMNDNIRPALYGSDYACDLVDKMNEKKDRVVTVAGKCCESGDILVPAASLPEAQIGDVLAVYTTGAYGYSMASHYNKLPVPGVVFVEGDQIQWAVYPQSLEDLIRFENSEVTF